jgi:hypothetical protein
MAAVTLTVPAEYAEGFRKNALGEFNTRADALDVESLRSIHGGELDVAAIQMDRAKLGAVAELLDSIGWEGSADELAVTADASVIERVLRGALIDLGPAIHEQVEKAELDVDSVRATMAQIEGLLQMYERVA